MNGTGILKNAAIGGAKLTYTESGSSFTKENVTFTSGTIDIGGALDSLVEGEQAVSYTHLDVYKRQVAESPYVGTGIEGKCARDSRSVVLAEADGIVASATAEVIITTKDRCV